MTTSIDTHHHTARHFHIMRPLIRPVLFAIARLGLFLSVVAWVVGQWWSVDVKANGLFALSSDKGIAVGAYSLSSLRVPTTTIVRTQNLRTNLDFNYWLFSPEEHSEMLTRSNISIYAIRVGYYFWRPGTTLREVSFHHWLITTIFAAFNLTLHFIYRRRPEVQPCEN